MHYYYFNSIYNCVISTLLCVCVWCSHLATRDRRVRALKELARILRVGGRILITVWAKEQRHRKVSQLRQPNASLFFVVVSISLFYFVSCTLILRLLVAAAVVVVVVEYVFHYCRV